MKGCVKMGVTYYAETVDEQKIYLSNLVTEKMQHAHITDFSEMTYIGTDIMPFLANDGDILDFGNGTTIERRASISNSIGFYYLDAQGERHGYGISGVLPIKLYLSHIASEYPLVVKAYLGFVSEGQDSEGRYLQWWSSDAIEEWFSHLERTDEDTDPYDEGENSSTGGGTGNFDGTSDAISIPGLPTLSAVNAGFITLYNPSVTDMGNLAAYLWSGAFDIETYRKIFSDPMDAILGLSIVPVNVPNAGYKNVKVGNIDTGLSFPRVATQYVEVDCGSLNVNEYWGAYLDYEPYTKMSIYLPYIGAHPLSTDDVMGTSVHVVYHVDILSGACTAFVKCGQSVMYEFIGQCSSSIPITGDNFTNVINGALTIAGSIGAMVATQGASAPFSASAIASMGTNAMSMKPSIEKSGSMSGTGGMLGVQTPYLIIERPRQALPEGQVNFIGYPSFITYRLGQLQGYTEVYSIHLENIPATDNELDEIERVLKSGVIINV